MKKMTLSSTVLIRLRFQRYWGESAVPFLMKATTTTSNSGLATKYETSETTLRNLFIILHYGIFENVILILLSQSIYYIILKTIQNSRSSCNYRIFDHHESLTFGG